MRKFHGNRTLLLGLKLPPGIDEIARVTGVAGVEAAGDKLFRVSFAGDIDPSEELARRAAEKSWGLFQLTPTQSSLEDVFVQLTRKEEQT